MFLRRSQVKTELEEVMYRRLDEINLETPREVELVIKTNINEKKAPGFELITGEILKQVPRKGVVVVMYLINAVFKLKYVPGIRKVSEIIMLPKLGKRPNDVKSSRRKSFYQWSQKLLKKTKANLRRERLDSRSQFGFRENIAPLSMYTEYQK